MTSSSVVGSPPCAFRRSGTNAFPEARRALHALGLSSFLAGGPRRGSLVIEIRMDLDRPETQVDRDRRPNMCQIAQFGV